jgi:hypothetical protein
VLQFDQILHRGAIKAAQVAAVGDGKAKVGYLPAVNILHR